DGLCESIDIPGCEKQQDPDAYQSRHDSVAGSSMMKVVPVPSVVSIRSAPPCALTMSLLSDRPRPVPCPVGLVVKNGWKILSAIDAGMPGPLSATRMITM